MPALEDKIKDFVRHQGVEVVGIAGPERLDGPPSLDLKYTMPGARWQDDQGGHLREGAITRHPFTGVCMNKAA